MFDYKEYFSNLSCYEEYCLKCTLLGKDKSDKEILNSFRKNEDYYYFIDNNGEVIWLDEKGNKENNPEITKIEDWNFSYCNSLKLMNIPNYVNYIGRFTFYGCNSLKSITIPNSVTEIEGYAFSYCNSLKSITIPDSVTKIRDCAFSKTPLKEVIISKDCKIKNTSFPDYCKIIRK